MSAALADRGVDHVVLDRGRPGETWRTQRWDSLPAEHAWVDEPDARRAGGRRIRRRRGGCPAVGSAGRAASRTPRRSGHKTGTQLLTGSSRRPARSFSVRALSSWLPGDQNVPQVPPLARTLPEGIVQQHTADYRGPGALPPGGVLVVGSGQSGCQITEDLLAADRRVVLATSPASRLPPGGTGAGSSWHGSWMQASGTSDRRTSDPAMIRAAQPIVASGVQPEPSVAGPRRRRTGRTPTAPEGRNPCVRRQRQRQHRRWRARSPRAIAGPWLRNSFSSTAWMQRHLNLTTPTRRSISTPFQR